MSDSHSAGHFEVSDLLVVDFDELIGVDFPLELDAVDVFAFGAAFGFGIATTSIFFVFDTSDLFESDDLSGTAEGLC